MTRESAISLQKPCPKGHGYWAQTPKTLRFAALEKDCEFIPSAAKR